METVSISELKAHLSRYLRHVRRGGEVQILDRGVPIARITALSAAPERDDGEDRERLIAAGLIRPGRGDASEILERPPLELPSSVVDALDEERTDRL